MVIRFHFCQKKFKCVNQWLDKTVSFMTYSLDYFGLNYLDDQIKIV